MKFLLPLLSLFSTCLLAAEAEFPLTPDSQPQAGVAKGTMIKDSYTAKDGSVFPGTEREYQIYLPAGFDQSKPAAFMVFQDGVIYQTPVVFDNLIAKKDI
ncbi:MAG: esterase family protein, partial [Prosthecobacter sp.]|nr:esterase family protein [Prosthecobacter sp.]